MSHFAQTLQSQLASGANVQNDRLSTLTQSNEQRLEAVRATVEQRLELLRTDNAQKLEQMRTTVDEKLHATLEARLGESFKQVADRLEQVHGPRRNAAAGKDVGSLSRVLNIRLRGTWGGPLRTSSRQMLRPSIRKERGTRPVSLRRVDSRSLARTR